MKNFNVLILDLKNNFIFYLICLYPWFLVSGPFMSDVILLIISLYYLSIKKNLSDLKKYYSIIFWILCIYLTINSLLIAKNLMSLKSAIFYFRFGVFILAISYFLKLYEKRINYIFYSFSYLLILLVIDSIFQKIFGFNLIGIQMENTIRVSSFFGDELVLGSFTIKLLPIVLGLLFLTNMRKKKMISIILLIASIFPILFSAEKASLIHFIIFIMIFIISIDINLKIKISIATFIILIISLFLITNESLNKRLIKDLVSNSNKGQYIFSKVHDSNFRTAFNMFKDKPLFGHGPKMFRIKCSDKKYQHDIYSCSTHPHNFYLQLLSETGLVGFTFFIIFYFFLIFKFLFYLFKSVNNKSEKYSFYFFISSLLLIFLPISTSGNIFNNWLSCQYAFTLGFFLYSTKYCENSR